MINQINHRKFYMDEVSSDGLYKLSEIHSHCKEYNEKITYSEELFSQRFTESLTLEEWLYDYEYNDERALLQEMINQWSASTDDTTGNVIFIGFVEDYETVTCLKQYVDRRRIMLAKTSHWKNFMDLLYPCFPYLSFSIHIGDGIKKIKDLRNYASYITHDLIVLNDDGYHIYFEKKEEPASALREIKARVLDCCNDPKHKNQLCFLFYSDNHEQLSLCCQNHTKIKRKDSDVRIYFCWPQPNVKQGENILIGHIGQHPY